MLNYNICFLKQGDKVLLLNREYPTWMGVWNGVGGKLEQNETPRASALREVHEETNIALASICFKGLVTWSVNGASLGGMYTYMAESPPDYKYETPIKTPEGVLDWKTIDWIKHPDNQGVAYFIPGSIDKILFDSQCYEQHCVYEDGKLIKLESAIIDPSIEDIKDKEQINRIIFNKYATLVRVTI